MSSFVLTPSTDLEPIDASAGHWSATGTDPAFTISCPDGAPMPVGWCRFCCDLSIEAANESPSLYIDDGYGFLEEERINLTYADGHMEHIIYLPFELVKLRFDPTDQPGEFTIKNIRFATLDEDEIAPAPASRHLAFRNTKLIAAQYLRPIADKPGAWTSLGDDPSFKIVLKEKGKRRRAGWVRVQARVSGLDGTKLYPSIYRDEGRGFSESTRQFLRLEQGAIDDVAFLTAETTGLRFDPLESKGSFKIDSFSISPVARLRALGILFRRFWSTLDEEERDLRKLAGAVSALSRRHRPNELLEMFFRRAQRPQVHASYRAWLDQVEAPAKQSEAEIRAEIAAFHSRPVFAIIVPVYNTPKEWLASAIDSVRAQFYEDWELCICDDASPERHVGEMLAAYAARDPRIKIHRRTENGHISRASNDAIALATGSHMVLMDHDDLIPRHALFEFARLLNQDPTVDFIYSDEDKISTSGVRYEPFFKPDWSPEYLEGCMYVSHLACYDMRIIREIGNFRSECDGSQDYDFALRYTERARNIRHIPKILYHWRAIPGSTASAMSNKDYAVSAGVRALEDRARRTGRLSFARPGVYPGCYEMRRAIIGEPMVSIVIPSAGRDAEISGQTIDLLANCLDSIASKSTYGNYEIVVVDNGDLREGTKVALQRHGARCFTYLEPAFNVAAKMNLGARHARGTVTVFLDDDTEVITPDWLESMIATLQIAGVGAVGPKLLFENGELQNVGVTFSGGTPDEIRRGYPRNDSGYVYSSVCTRNYMALTGACLMVDRSAFEEIGGFDEQLPIGYSDIDLCLKIWSTGRRIVFDPHAQLYHFESCSRSRAVNEVETAVFYDRWQTTVSIDPYYPEWLQRRPPTFELDPFRF